MKITGKITLLYGISTGPGHLWESGVRKMSGVSMPSASTGVNLAGVCGTGEGMVGTEEGEEGNAGRITLLCEMGTGPGNFRQAGVRKISGVSIPSASPSGLDFVGVCGIRSSISLSSSPSKASGAGAVYTWESLDLEAAGTDFFSARIGRV